MVAADVFTQQSVLDAAVLEIIRVTTLGSVPAALASYSMKYGSSASVW